MNEELLDTIINMVDDGIKIGSDETVLLNSIKMLCVGAKIGGIEEQQITPGIFRNRIYYAEKIND